MDHTRAHPDDYNPPLASWYPLKFAAAEGFEEEIDAGRVNHWRHRSNDGVSPWKEGRAPMCAPVPCKFADKDITETLEWLERQAEYWSVLGGDDDLDILPLRRTETLIRRLAREAGYSFSP